MSDLLSSPACDEKGMSSASLVCSEQSVPLVQTTAAPCMPVAL